MGLQEKRKLLTILGCLAVPWLLLSFQQPSETNSFRLLSTEDSPATEEAPRPVIWTFYENAINTGMSDVGDRRLLRAWKASWREAGWDPKVATNAHATRLPEYEEIMSFIDTEFTGQYNTNCFARWLAMAAIGGGWMCDYDNFPLEDFTHENHPLPNDGNLTLYQGFVPSLVSGSKQEYLRVAWEMARRFKEHDERKEFYSDMLALKDMEDDGLVQTTNVVVGFNGADQRHLNFGVDHVLNQTDCEYTAGKRGVHFSHHVIQEMVRKRLNSPSTSADDRSWIARTYYKQWTDVCANKTEPGVEASEETMTSLTSVE